jgi:hypothetical protein
LLRRFAFLVSRASPEHGIDVALLPEMNLKSRRSDCITCGLIS